MINTSGEFDFADQKLISLTENRTSEWGSFPIGAGYKNQNRCHNTAFQKTEAQPMWEGLWLGS